MLPIPDCELAIVDGTSAQAGTAVNFYLSPTMFKMLVGYYLLAVFDPHCTVNEGLYDAVDVAIPEGSILRPVRPAALSCRTHLLGRVMDVIQALMGQHNPAYRAADIACDGAIEQFLEYGY